MKNNVFLLSAMLFSGIAFAQVGVNTSNPESTFDITAKNAKGNATSIDGLLVPRVDRERAQSMSKIPLSTLIYVNDITTGTQAGITVNIDIEGYYYFDGNVWVKLNPNITGTDQDNNIYNTNGTLLENRIVTQNDKTLSFLGDSVNGFSVDGNTFSVDSKNNRIGFGTTTPSSRFEIISDNKGGGAGNNLYFKGFGSSIEPSILLSSAQGTASSPVNLNNNDLIGSLLFIPRIASGLSTSAGTRLVSQYKGDGTTPSTNLMISTSGVERMRIDETGNVGVGISAPTSKVDILDRDLPLAAGPKTGIRLRGISPTAAVGQGMFIGFHPNITVGGDSPWGIGAQFTSAANNQGDADFTFKSSSGNVWADRLTIKNNGNVGIGTTNPEASVILDLTANNKGFLPPRLTTAQRDALNPKPAGLTVYNVTTNCMEFWNSSEWVSTCAAVVPPVGSITQLNCSSASNSGALTAGAVASGVTSTVPYTGGNGGTHGGETRTSTGVTGLTATLSAGSFVNGNGNLVYTITGTPSAAGTASFALNIGGKNCTIQVPVSAAAAIVTDLNCGAATNTGTLTAGVAASGVSSAIPYSGGNSGSHGTLTVNSTGVTGLTATLAAGTIGTIGNLTYTITGTPSGAGTANFNINFGGKSCTLSRTVAASAGTITSLNCSGATQNGTLRNNTPASGVTLTIPYTGGNGGSYAAQSFTSTGVPGLTATLAAGNLQVGNGNLVFNITGTPLGEGTANFNITIAGKNCPSVGVTVNTLNEGDFNCGSTAGPFAYPNNNTKYVMCIKIGNSIVGPYIYTCPSGTFWNDSVKQCRVP